MHSVRTWTLALLLAALVVSLALTGSAGANGKDYTVALSPNPAPGNTQGLHVTATFTNTSSTNQSIGSVQLTAVSGGVTVVGSTTPGASVNGNTVTYNSLTPIPRGSSGSVEVTVNTPAVCSGSEQWNVSAHQANNFNSPNGNVFNPDPTSVTMAVSGACGIRFESTNQPHDAFVKPATITNADYAPGGPPKVDVLDANGRVQTNYNGPVSVALNTPNNPLTNPTPSTLGGTTTQTASNGVASFGDLTVDKPGNQYTLTASVPNSSLTTTSSTFDIHQAGTVCGQGQSCKTDSSNLNAAVPGTLDATVTSPGTFLGVTNPPAILSETLDFGTWPAATRKAQCPDETPDAHFVYDSFTDSSGKIVTRTFEVSITTQQSPLANIPALIPGQLMCFASAHDFEVQVGDSLFLHATPVTLPDGSPGFAGQLPTCNNATGTNNPLFPRVDPTQNPCVSDREGIVSGITGGTLTIKASSPFDAYHN
jgi:hypothetical protein